MSNETDIRPFRVDVPDEAIADLGRRIAATRWPTRELVADRAQGVQLATIQELARYWTSDYDWRRWYRMPPTMSLTRPARPSGGSFPVSASGV
jgi:epoxide hydrolase-like protein